jgi:hypothetical protein
VNKAKEFYKFLQYFLGGVVWAFKRSWHDFYAYKQRFERRIQNFKSRGKTLKVLAAADKKRQDLCNHHKGGSSAFTLKGDDSQYSVVKHVFANGDMHVICLRCKKKWRPTDDDQEAYKKALDFPTRNVPSSSVRFRFSDGGKHFASKVRDY